MIKKILLAALVAIPMCAAAQAPKFGVVSVETIFEAMPERTNAQEQLEKASKQYEDEYKKLNDDLDKKYAEFQNLDKDETTPESIKERRIQEMQEMQTKIQQFRTTAQQDLQRQQEQLMAPIQEKITTAIKAIGTENGYTMILPDGVAAYMGSNVEDVTQMVKAKLGLQ